MERNRELKIHTHTRDRTVHTKEEMQKDRDTEKVKRREREFPGGPVVRTYTISLPRALVQSLVGELKSLKPQSVAKIKQKCSQQCFCDSARSQILQTSGLVGTPVLCS